MRDDVGAMIMMENRMRIIDVMYVMYAAVTHSTWNKYEDPVELDDPPQDFKIFVGTHSTRHTKQTS